MDRLISTVGMQRIIHSRGREGGRGGHRRSELGSKGKNRQGGERRDGGKERGHDSTAQHRGLSLFVSVERTNRISTTCLCLPGRLTDWLNRA